MSALPIFPSLSGLAFPITRTNLGFAVVSQQSVSGARTRFAQRSKPLYRWKVSFEFLRAASIRARIPFAGGRTFESGAAFSEETLQELQTLAGFYNGRFGKALPFLYIEPDDSVAVSQIFGKGDGTTRTFQLTRTLGGFTEPVFAPIGTPIITVGGDLVTALSVGSTGIVTFDAPPAANALLVWSGRYAWRVRFDDDSVDFNMFLTGVASVDQLTFSSETMP